MTKRLTAADLALEDDVVGNLAGSLSILGGQMIVRVENILINEGWRGRRSLKATIDHLEVMARREGMSRLVIEGVSVGNPRLARVLTGRYGGVYTPQRTIVIDRSLA